MLALPREVALGIALGAALLGATTGCKSVSALRQRCLAGEVSGCEAACRKGVPGEGGCFHAGERHRELAALNFASADFRSSADFFRLSCDGGYADGCLFAAQTIEAPYAAVEPAGGAELPKMISDGEVKAREQRLVKACSLGSAAGCKRLGDALIGKTAEPAKAAYEKACRAGGASGECTAARTREVDIAERFRLGCTHRQADQCTSLGNLLFATDPPRAIRLFASECELRGVAELEGGLGSFIRARERQAAQGIALPDDAPPAPPPPGAPPVDGHVVRVSGEVALVEVDRALVLHRGELTRCMATLPGAAAVTLSVRLVVDRSGDVWRASITDGAAGTDGALVSSCITGTLEALSFTEPHGGVATVDLTITRPAATPAVTSPIAPGRVTASPVGAASPPRHP